MKITVGESQITPEILNRLAPDIVSPSGLQKLSETFGKVVTKKPQLDSLLNSVAQKHDSDFESRIKNVQTAAQKIVQKRLQGRDYNIDDLNDPYGARIVADSKDKIPQIASDIAKLSKSGAFDILKSEQVKDGTYSAHHFDIQTPDGGRGEIQLTTPQQELEAVANHSLRSVYGDNAPKPVEALSQKQASLAKQTPNDQAKTAIKQIQQTAKAQNGQPLDPRVIAGILKTVIS